MKFKGFLKKFTSVGLAFALVLSGNVCKPESVKAAAKLPEVTVLGATLSLDADSGYQSMRVAIQVENADNASECGMDITYNGKKLSFSTADSVNNKLYDVDADKNNIIYTVKIKNIPVDNFGDEFTIEGFATPINTNGEQIDKVEAASAETRSVNGVVEAIKKATGDDSIRLSSDGALIKADDTVASDITKVTPLNNNETGVSYDENLDAISGTSTEGVIIPLNKKLEAGYLVNATVSGSKTGSAALRAYFSNSTGNSVSNDPGTSFYINFDEPFEYELTEDSEYITIKSTYQAKFDSLTISDVNINYAYKKLTANDIGDVKLDKSLPVDLTDAGNAYAFDGGVSSNYNSETETLELLLDEFGGVVFYLPVESENYDIVELTYNSEHNLSIYPIDGSMTDGMGQFAAGQHEISGGIPASATDKTIRFEADDTYVNGCIKGLKIVHADWCWGQKGIKIKSVKFLKSDKPATSPEPETEYICDEIDLSDSSMFMLDNVGAGDTVTSATYNENDGSLEVKLQQLTGVDFFLPDDSKKYEYIDVTYSSSGGYFDMSTYLYDSDFNYNFGQNAPGTHEIEKLAASENETTVRLNVKEGFNGDCIKALKFFSFTWGNTVTVKFKSIKAYGKYDNNL